MHWVDQLNAYTHGVVRQQIERAEKPPVQIFGAIEHPEVVDSILEFTLDDTCMWFWDAALILAIQALMITSHQIQLLFNQNQLICYTL